MEDVDIRLECLRLASGDAKAAERFYGWVTNQPTATPSNFLTAEDIESGLDLLTGAKWSVTGGKDGLFRVANELKAEAVRFSDSELAMSLEDFTNQVLKPLVDKFNS